MAKQTNSYISFKNISLTYFNSSKNQPTQALSDISFEIKQGEFITIIGPSGCGKTTLLNCLAGLIQPQTGEILIDNKPIKALGQKTAMVFQDPLLLPWRTVLGNIIYGLEINGVSQDIAQKKAKNILITLGLSEFEKYYPHQLSGGMRQRVNLGRALICNPDILLLDEPLSHLDNQTREQLQLEILRLHQLTKKTFIFVTHMVEEAVFLADKLIILNKRPGNLKKILNIDLKNPRTLKTKESQAFLNLKQNVNNILSLNHEK